LSKEHFDLAGWDTEAVPLPRPLDTGGELVWEAGATLAEGPLWDETTGSLLLVDIAAGKLHRLETDACTVASLEVGAPMSSVIPRAAGGLVVTMTDTLVSVNDGGSSLTDLVHFEGVPAGGRMNDAKCDPEGRLFAGSMSTSGGFTGSLFRVDADLEVIHLIGDVGISNGLAWSSDRGSLFYVDSALGSIDRFSYDLASGHISDRTVVVRIDPGFGAPDGLCIDTEDHLWVAVFGGGVVCRYDPAGILSDELELPAPNVTSCCFGGPGFDELYVTTAREGMSEADLDRNPLSGSVFRFRLGVTGTPPVAFAG
jgi:sugar lactone lactonase YvrE